MAAASGQPEDLYARVRSSIDVERMSRLHVLGIGGCFDLIAGHVRCGVGRVTLVDFDRVGRLNSTRQDFDIGDSGQLKVDVHAERLKRINPSVTARAIARNVCDLSDSEVDELLRGVDEIIVAVDDFEAVRWANRHATARGIAILFVHLYIGGRAGEIIYWVPGVTRACYREIASKRFEYFDSGVPTTTSSDGGTIFDLRMVDAVAGQIALGILNRGAPNRYGRLIDDLGDRNFLQVKIDPAWKLGGTRDVFREHLGDGPGNFSFTTIALPMTPDPECPDCGHRWNRH